MKTTNKPISKSLLANRHLREQKDNAVSEVQAFYSLKCRHKLERDRFSFEQNTKSRELIALIERQQQEITSLKEQQNHIRANISERHRQEIARFTFQDDTDINSRLARNY